MTSDLDVRERHELCDLLDDLGPDAPTLCEGWTTADLAAHLAVRERRPLAAPGILLGGRFEHFTERCMAQELERHGYHGTIERVRTGPPIGPTWPAPVRHAVNLIEMTVHHEDARRPNGGAPRTDRPDLDDEVWTFLRRLAGPLALRARLRVRLNLVAEGRPPVTMGRGAGVATLTGPPVEILLHLQGRAAASGAVLSGDPEAVAAVQDANFAI